MNLKVRLNASQRGNFSIVPTTIAAQPEDRIIWSAGGRPFTIQFLRRSPLRDVTTHQCNGKESPGEIVGDVPNGIYEYAVAIYDPRSGRVSLHVSGEVQVRRRFP